MVNFFEDAAGNRYTRSLNATFTNTYIGGNLASEVAMGIDNNEVFDVRFENSALKLLRRKKNLRLIDGSKTIIKEENRIISGSIISGREAIGPFAYLGRYHNQISVIAEPNSKDREFMNWLTPGPRKFSKMPVFLSSLFPKKVFKFKALMNGSDRPIVPIGSYEEVLPFNMLPIMLLRNIVLLDTEKLQALGGLELDEEDLSLCSYICPGKYDFGSLLRAGLTKIEVEG